MYSVSMDRSTKASTSILVNIIAFFRVRTGQDFVSEPVWTFAARAGAALALAADKIE